MSFVVYSLVGIVGGLLGGMGMGGGTLLIPLLTIFCNVDQHLAQAINLISFIPMAVIALVIHIKNKLIDTKKILWIILPGCLSCVGGSFLSKAISSDLLTKFFGGFLVVLAIVQFITEIRKKS